MALSSRGCWFSKLDLSNCFLSFPLRADAQEHFIFRFENQLWKFRAMPFGLASAPRICTELLSVVAHALRRCAAARHVRYLDDFLFISKSAADSQAVLDAAQVIFAEFGLVVNTAKTAGPAQRLDFLGIDIDSRAETLSCSAARIAELMASLDVAIQSRVIKRRALDTLVGKLSFAAQVLPGARPFMRAMHDASARCRTAHTPVRTNPAFRADLRHWRSFLTTWNGRCCWRSPRAHEFYSDASLSGFAFYLHGAPTAAAAATLPPRLRPGAAFAGAYSAGEHSEIASTHRGIGWCELLAVLAAATTYAPHLRDGAALFHVDNAADVAIINRQATRSALLMPLLRALYSLATEFNFSIRAQHEKAQTPASET